MLNHVALQIENEKDIKDFYTDILGFRVKTSFELNSKLSADIFGLKKEVKVVVIEKDDLDIELFVVDLLIPFQGYPHLCLDVSDREKVLNLCRARGYEVTEIDRKKHNLYFVRDRSDNLFELKEK